MNWPPHCRCHHGSGCPNYRLTGPKRSPRPRCAPLRRAKCRHWCRTKPTNAPPHHGQRAGTTAHRRDWPCSHQRNARRQTKPRALGPQHGRNCRRWLGGFPLRSHQGLWSHETHGICPPSTQPVWRHSAPPIAHRHSPRNAPRAWSYRTLSSWHGWRAGWRRTRCRLGSHPANRLRCNPAPNHPKPWRFAAFQRWRTAPLGFAGHPAGWCQRDKAVLSCPYPFILA